MARSSANDETMLIGEMAERTGVSRRSLRHYEHKGLLANDRSADNGCRRYSTDDVGRVERITELVAMGLPLTAVSAVLPCLPEELSCPELDRAGPDRRAVGAAGRATPGAGLLDRAGGT